MNVTRRIARTMGDSTGWRMRSAHALLADAENTDALAVDCWNLAHHGGEKNTSTALAADLVFNYDSKCTAVWNKPARFAPYKYVPDYPSEAGTYTVEP